MRINLCIRIVVSLFCMFIYTYTALAAPKPVKNIVLMYKVSDEILMCQNSAEDIVAGAKEFEEELRNHYGKRFIVDSVRRLPVESLLTADDYLKMVKFNEIPFVLKLKLNGTGNAWVTYQNMFGARVSAELPTVKILREEYTVDRTDCAIYGVSYSEAQYHSNSTAYGGTVYSNTNIRTITKNGIRGYIRDYCTYLGNKINKYADIELYNKYNDYYTGDFKKQNERDLVSMADVPYLGVCFGNDLVVMQIFDSSAYKAAGGLAGDKIVSVNGENVETSADYSNIIKKIKAGSAVKFVVIRNQKEVMLNVVTGVRSMQIYKNMKV